MGEFELIRQFFQQHSAETQPDSVILGIGDDAALLQPPAGQALAVTTDTLVSDVHFPPEAPAEEIAQRVLRVNLSDLAAMGAEPLWFTLALTAPELPDAWLADFSRGLFAAANEYGCSLVGGDTTAGPLSITVQVMGSLTPSQALRRDGAEAGDAILVTGSTGDAAAGLAWLQERLPDPAAAEHRDYFLERYYRPSPRLAEARSLRDLATAALDVSDGLVADLAHICRASDLGADLYVEELPLSNQLQALSDRDQALRWALTGGDDYELCFTLPEARLPELGERIATGDLQAKVIGRMRPGHGVECFLRGEPYRLDAQGYRHF